ncbi:MAG: prepilin-type N-terminal cleavage/methylation domain-containing protein [Haliea sp.]|nr:prepilin-type N-terminal cleavage/methylation domain-containing protein [Haliea sp.]
MDRMSLRAPSAGLTLMELMIVLALVALLLGLGVPSMQKLLHGNRLRAEAHRLLAAINMTRSEAVLRNGPVSMCPSAMARTGRAECSGVYAQGWIVFSNADRDRVIDPGIDEVLQVFEALPPGYSLTNRSGTRELSDLISYLPDGSSRKNRSLVICSPPQVPVDSLSIVINIVGRPRLAKDWGQCARG